jgi:hypothetical protein
LEGGLEPGDPVDRGREQDSVAQLGGPQPQAGREVCLPIPGGPSWTMLEASLRNVPVARDAIVSLLRPGGWSKLKSSGDLWTGEACCPDAGFGAGVFPGGDFPGEDRGEVFLMGPAGLASRAAASWIRGAFIARE